jgi:hypothetical protein
MTTFRNLEINGGRVEKDAPDKWSLILPAVSNGYADAQIDDYGGRKRKSYPWLAGTRMELRACFSHPAGDLVGTAGFGFWNAPFGDPTVPWPALPQAVWFFYGSDPTNLPLAVEGPGRGWFASTVCAARRQAVALTPAAPIVLLLNQVSRWRKRLWPAVRQRLGVSYRPLEVGMTGWHTYSLDWGKTNTTFFVDNQLVLQTPFSPGGPLGFVYWLDNQYLILTPTGRFGWGTIPLTQQQSLLIDNLKINAF